MKMDVDIDASDQTTDISPYEYHGHTHSDFEKESLSSAQVQGSCRHPQFLSTSITTSGRRGDKLTQVEIVSRAPVVDKDTEIVELQQALDREREARQRTEEQLAESCKRSIEVKDCLDEKEMYLKDVETQKKRTQDSLDKAKSDLAQKSQDAAEYCKLWKRTGKELNTLRAMEQGFYKITDQYLIQLFVHLRILIRDFAIQYFDGKSLDVKAISVRRKLPFGNLFYETCLSPNDLDTKLRRPSRCQEVIQSFLWRVIECDIFGKYDWLGSNTRRQFLALCKQLRRCK